MENKQYWESRALQLEDKIDLTSRQLNNRFKKMFKKSEIELQSKIDKLYRKYATDMKIDLVEAHKLIEGTAFKEWRMSIGGYVKELKKTGNKSLYKELETLATRSRISRLDAILSEVRAETNLLYSNNLPMLSETLENTYKTSYYLNSYTIQHGTGIYYQIATVDKKKMQKIMEYKNYGKNFSSRIWDHKEKLSLEVQREIAQGFATSKDLKAVSKGISERYGVSYNNATRLVNTENNFYMNQASLDSYKEADVEMYQILATLDKRTSSICQSMDELTFKSSQASVGDNFPPFHSRCRTTTIAYFGKNYTERIARDENDKNIYVSGKLDYKKWEKKYNIK